MLMYNLADFFYTLRNHGINIQQSERAANYKHSYIPIPQKICIFKIQLKNIVVCFNGHLSWFCSLER